MKISFDPAKRVATLQNRGLDMSRADEAISGVNVTIADAITERPGSLPSPFSISEWLSLCGPPGARIVASSA